MFINNMYFTIIILYGNRSRQNRMEIFVSNNGKSKSEIQKCISFYLTWTCRNSYFILKKRGGNSWIILLAGRGRNATTLYVSYDTYRGSLRIYRYSIIVKYIKMKLTKLWYVIGVPPECWFNIAEPTSINVYVVPQSLNFKWLDDLTFSKIYKREILTILFLITS